MYWKATLILGVIVLWTFLSLLPRPGFEPGLLPEFIPVTKINPTVQVIASSFHDVGHENAWIQFVDKEERLVQVQAVESRIVIVFRVKKKEDVARYNVGWIAPITFLCAKGRTDCDIGSQEKTYVGNLEVEPTIWKTSGSNRKLKIQQK